MTAADKWSRDGQYVGHFPHLRTYLSGDDSLVPFAALVRARRAWAYPQPAKVAGTTPEQRADRREEARYLEQELRTIFVRQHGKIVNEYYCRYAVGAAALTDASDARFADSGLPARDLHTVLNSSSDRLITGESSCHVLVNDAVTVFGAEPRDRANLVYSTDGGYHAMSAVLLAADALADPDQSAGERKAALAGAARQVQLAKDRVGLLVQRHARFAYFTGVLLGSLAALLLCVVLGVVTAIRWSAFISTRSLVAAMVFGVLGAVTSVFQRISSGGLVLDFTAPEWQLRLLGGLRPVIGGMFGAIAQFAAVAGLTGQGQGASGASVGFFAVVGFAAGFSERFATDMVERAGRLLTGAPASATPSPTRQPAADDGQDTAVTADEVDEIRRRDGHPTVDLREPPTDPRMADHTQPRHPTQT